MDTANASARLGIEKLLKCDWTNTNTRLVGLQIILFQAKAY